MTRLQNLLLGDTTANRVVPPSGFTASLTVISSAAMAFLAVFAIALFLAAGELSNRWEAELSGTATIRLPVSETIDDQVTNVLAALDQTPGIVSARRIDDSEQLALLAPWFGQDIPLGKLRLPVLIEVEETQAGPDVEGLSNRLAAEAPGAVYDNHSRWRIPLVEAADRLRNLALISLLLIASVVAVTIALAASSALAANGQIVDVLRLVGAEDRWIANAFTRRFTLRALGGAFAGAIIAAIAVALIPSGVDAGILSGLGFRGGQWLFILSVPCLAAGLAFLATQIAVARRLKEDG